MNKLIFQALSTSSIAATMLLFTPSLNAKTAPGIEGEIKDLSGQPITNVTVRYCASEYSSYDAFNPDPDSTRCNEDVLSDSQGRFKVESLDLGTKLGILKLNAKRNWVSLLFKFEDGSVERYGNDVFNVNRPHQWDELFGDSFKQLTYFKASFPLTLKVPSAIASDLRGSVERDYISVSAAGQTIFVQKMWGGMTSFDKQSGSLTFGGHFSKNGELQISKLIEDYDTSAPVRIEISTEPVTSGDTANYGLEVDLVIEDALNMDVARFEAEVVNNINDWSFDGYVASFKYHYQ